jgi:hypothetical protein
VGERELAQRFEVAWSQDGRLVSFGFGPQAFVRASAQLRRTCPGGRFFAYDRRDMFRNPELLTRIWSKAKPTT